MNVTEALNVLDPPLFNPKLGISPSEIFKFLQETKCIKFDNEKVLLCESFGWLVKERNKVVEDYKRNERHMTLYLKYMKENMRCIKEGLALLESKALMGSNKIPIEQAKEATHKFYLAGYFECKSDLLKVSKEEREAVHSRDEALDVIAKHLDDVRNTFVVNEKGDLVLW